jgi:hypothetical protein
MTGEGALRALLAACPCLVKPWTLTQTDGGLASQLDAGVRFLDFRLAAAATPVRRVLPAQLKQGDNAAEGCPCCLLGLRPDKVQPPGTEINAALSSPIRQGPVDKRVVVECKHQPAELGQVAAPEPPPGARSEQPSIYIALRTRCRVCPLQTR